MWLRRVFLQNNYTWLCVVIHRITMFVLGLRLLHVSRCSCISMPAEGSLYKQFFRILVLELYPHWRGKKSLYKQTRYPGRSCILDPDKAFLFVNSYNNDCTSLWGKGIFSSEEMSYLRGTFHSECCQEPLRKHLPCLRNVGWMFSCICLKAILWGE